jgi:hypothetical protein
MHPGWLARGAGGESREGREGQAELSCAREGGAHALSTHVVCGWSACPCVTTTRLLASLGLPCR